MYVPRAILKMALSSYWLEHTSPDVHISTKKHHLQTIDKLVIDTLAYNR